MFFGTTPSIVAQYIASEMLAHQPERVFVPFAGNFIVEQIAAQLPTVKEIHSTDVSLYSKAIGHGLTNNSYPIELAESVASRFGLNRNPEPLEQAAQVIFLTESMMNVKKAEKHAFYKALDKFATQTSQASIDKILKKLVAIKTKLAGRMSFTGQDACRLLPSVGKGDFVFYDPPVSLGDYEKMFKAVESVYTYAPEPYTVITEELKMQQLEELHARGATIYWRTNNPIQPPSFLRLVFYYKYKYTAAYCIYSNAAKKTFVGQFKPLQEVAPALQCIGEQDVIDQNTKVEVVPVSTFITNHYRLMWVKKAQMLDSGRGFLVLLNGKVAGCLQLAEGVKFGNALCLINSDPACPYSRYKRLSKLIIYLCCTRQVLGLVNDLSLWEHEGFTTRVFTNEPVSMKYRGLFELVERAEDEGHFKYRLIYQNRNKIFDSYQAALAAWLKKDGKVLDNE
jgi:16S rRNA G966 N2-methylase RsmD